MARISVVIGTRPEAIKLAPVVLALRQTAAVTCEVCLTAQHRGLLDQVLSVFSIDANVDLNLMQANQTLASLTARAIEGLDEYLAMSKPDLLLVQGDTTTVLCATLAGFYRRIPVGHVEAGLRTGNLQSPWPEEANRVLTTRLASLHFSPTVGARDNLTREGVAASQIFVTGNTGIDALLLAVERNGRAGGKHLHCPWRQWPGRVVLITAHRRENFGSRLEQICEAIADLSARFPEILFVYPVHPNPNVRQVAHQILGGADPRVSAGNVRLLDPLDYSEFVDLMECSTLIMTDSGGVQEEAPSLGKPVLVLRDTTERPEAVEAGTVLVVGSDRDHIVSMCTTLLRDEAAYRAMSRRHNPYGDGRAAGRIVEACVRFLNCQASGAGSGS